MNFHLQGTFDIDGDAHNDVANDATPPLFEVQHQRGSTCKQARYYVR